MTLHLYFKKYKKVILLEINQDSIKNEIAFEEVKSGSRIGKFPHLYGKLLIQNIKKDWTLKRNSFDLPKKVLEESEE